MDYTSKYTETAVSSTPWFTDSNTVMTLWVAYAAVCGIITLMIAMQNERSKVTALIAGFFMGGLGIATYAIMGESIKLRVYLEGQAMRDEIEREKKEKAASK